MFSTIDRLISKIGPVNQLVDGVLTRLAPQAEAAACGTSYYCYSSKGDYCYYGCVNGLAYRYWDEKKYYKYYPSGSCYVECIDDCDYYERWTGGDQYC